MPYISYRVPDEPGEMPAPRPNSSTLLGVISLCIGAAMLLVAWIPYLGMLAVPVAIGGGLVAVVALVIGRMAGQRKLPWPFVGLLVCGLSIGVSFVSTVAWQNRAGAPGYRPSTPVPPAIDMRGSKGPFVPAPTTTQPTFDLSSYRRFTTTAPGLERPD